MVSYHCGIWNWNIKIVFNILIVVWCFYGNGFPEILRGKERIYEGQPFEHFTSVQQKILAKFPGSVLYTDDGSDTKGLIGKYLDISVYPNKNDVFGSERRSFTILKKFLDLVQFLIYGLKKLLMKLNHHSLH